MSGAMAQADETVTLSPRVASLIPGLFCAADDRNRREAPDTMAGFIYEPEAPVEMVAEGQVLPAVIGLGFGVRYTLTDTDMTVLHYIVSHPAMPPNGMTVQRWRSDLSGGNIGTVFFQFDFENELQPGDWRIAAMIDGEVAFDVGFTVRPASDLPGLVGLCQGGSLLSLNQTRRAAAG